MTKTDITSALADAFAAHEKARQAIEESQVPAGLDSIVTGAVVSALSTRLSRILGPESTPASDYIVVSASDPEKLALLVTAGIKSGFAPLGGLQVTGQPLNFYQAMLK